MKFSERRARQRAREFSTAQAGDLAAERLGLLADAFTDLNDTVAAITTMHLAEMVSPEQDEALKRWALQVAPVFTRVAREIGESHAKLEGIFEPRGAA